VARSPYLDLLWALHESGVRYAIAGGFAAVIHGVPRMTFDIDLVLEMRALIERIVHLEIDEERRARDAFFTAIGVGR
jgi:hypothetical protein